MGVVSMNKFAMLQSVSDVWALALDKCGSLATTSETFVGTLEELHMARMGKPPRAKGAIAYLSLSGTLTQKGSFWGGTSMEAFGRAFDAAVANDKVGAILIEVDSGGGDARGTAELSDKIFAARGTKDIIAVANADAHSAAFWVASAADQLHVTPSGEVGSVGVWTMHANESKYLENMGVEITLVHAGKHKVDGHPFGPLPEEVRNDMQSAVDEINGNFHAALARNFGITRKEVKDNFGDGKSFFAPEAKKRGMVHGIGSFESVLDTMSGRKDSRSAGRIEMELQAAFYGVESPEEEDVEARLRLWELRQREGV